MKGTITSKDSATSYRVHTLTLRDQMQVNILRHQFTAGMYDSLATSKLAPDRFTAQWAYALAVLSQAIEDEGIDLATMDPQAVVDLLGVYDDFVGGSGEKGGDGSTSLRPRKSATAPTASPSAV